RCGKDAQGPHAGDPAHLMGRSSNGELARFAFSCASSRFRSPLHEAPASPSGAATLGRSQAGAIMLETYFPVSKMPEQLRSGPSGPYLMASQRRSRARAIALTVRFDT